MDISLDKSTAGWVPRRSMKERRMEFTMTSLSGNLWALGGTYKDSYSNTLEMYDPNTDTWTTKSTYPVRIWRHCTVADHENNRLYTMGGDYAYDKGKHVGIWNRVYYYNVCIKC